MLARLFICFCQWNTITGQVLVCAEENPGFKKPWGSLILRQAGDTGFLRDNIIVADNKIIGLVRYAAGCPGRWEKSHGSWYHDKQVLSSEAERFDLGIRFTSTAIHRIIIALD